MGLPGQTGQVSRALSQTVMTKSNSTSLNSSTDLLRASEASIWKLSRSIARAIGWGAAFGLTPALNTSNRSPPVLRSRYSARMLRAEFPVHRKRVLKRDFCMFIGIGGRFLLSSSRSGRGHSDYRDKVGQGVFQLHCHAPSHFRESRLPRASQRRHTRGGSSVISGASMSSISR